MKAHRAADLIWPTADQTHSSVRDSFHQPLFNQLSATAISSNGQLQYGMDLVIYTHQLSPSQPTESNVWQQAELLLTSIPKSAFIITYKAWWNTFSSDKGTRCIYGQPLGWNSSDRPERPVQWKGYFAWGLIIFLYWRREDRLSQSSDIWSFFFLIIIIFHLHSKFLKLKILDCVAVCAGRGHMETMISLVLVFPHLPMLTHMARSLVCVSRILTYWQFQEPPLLLLPPAYYTYSNRKTTHLH